MSEYVYSVAAFEILGNANINSVLDASINKLIDSCVENFKIENDEIIYYKKPKNEITIARSIRLRESMWNKLDKLKKEYDISLYKLINMSIKYTLDDK